MASKIWVLGEALMDCVAQPDGSLRPFMGGSPFNLARAAALRLGGSAALRLGGNAPVSFINPLSTDAFGDRMRAQFAADGVQTLLPASRLPTSLAVVQIKNGQPSYGFYRQGIADRDYTVERVLALLKAEQAGVDYRPTERPVLHTGSLLLVPPEHDKVVAILKVAKALGWIISVDVNLRPKLADNLADYLAAVKQVAALADWLKASDEDLSLLGFTNPSRGTAGEIAAHFVTQGASRIALTFGADGAWLQVDGQVADANVPPVKLVDTVGAGDTFWGNCLGDWVTVEPKSEAHPTQTSVPARERVASTLRNAMIAATINCSRAGCQPPAYEEVQKYG